MKIIFKNGFEHFYMHIVLLSLDLTLQRTGEFLENRLDYEFITF